MPWPFTTSHSWVVRLVGIPRILATVSACRKVSPSSTQFIRRMLSTSELTLNSPIIPEMLGMSSMMGEFKVSSLVDNILLMNWVELGDTFRHALTVAKMRGMPTSRTTHECEVVNGQGMKVLPRRLAVAVPLVPFAGYLGLISRAPERRDPKEVPEASSCG